MTITGKKSKVQDKMARDVLTRVGLDKQVRPTAGPVIRRRTGAGCHSKGNSQQTADSPGR